MRAVPFILQSDGRIVAYPLKREKTEAKKKRHPPHRRMRGRYISMPIAGPLPRGSNVRQLASASPFHQRHRRQSRQPRTIHSPDVPGLCHRFHFKQPEDFRTPPGRTRSAHPLPAFHRPGPADRAAPNTRPCPRHDFQSGEWSDVSKELSPATKKRIASTNFPPAGNRPNSKTPARRSQSNNNGASAISSPKARSPLKSVTHDSLRCREA